MAYGIKGSYGLMASGGGEGTLSVPVRVVAADPLPSSYRDLEWDPPTGKTATAYRVYYTEPGGERTLYGTYAGNVESVRVGDLSPETSGILFEVEADYTSTAVGSVSGSTGVQSAPTVPVARQAWAPCWQLTNQTNWELIPSGERRLFRGRFRNLTGKTAQNLAIGLLQGTGAPANYDISVGTWSGSGLDAASWTTNLAVTVPAAPEGAIRPGYVRHLIALPASVANNDRLLISIRPPSDDVITVTGFNENAWPDFGFAESVQITFGGTPDVAVDAAWPGGGIPGVFGCIGTIEFLGLSGDPVIQVAHCGDSLGAQERPFTSSPNPLSREGWITRGNIAEQTNGGRFHWHSIANGTYSLTSYLSRLSHLLTTDWINGVDVVSIQVWTHNERPANVAAAQAQWEAIEVVADAVRAAGRGVIYTLLCPPSSAGQTVDQIAGWQWMKDRIATEPHVYLDDVVADGSGTAIDVAYSSSDDPEPIHINQAGQILQANVLPARTATALQALGYEFP